MTYIGLQITMGTLLYTFVSPVTRVAADHLVLLFVHSGTRAVCGWWAVVFLAFTVPVVALGSGSTSRF